MADQDRGWIGVDLDGTLAEYHGWKGIEHIGPAVPKMLKRVLRWIEDGEEVKIFTARVGDPETRMDVFIHIQAWCREHLGTVLPVTNEKDLRMKALWDDRCVQVIPNTGEPVLASVPEGPCQACKGTNQVVSEFSGVTRRCMECLPPDTRARDKLQRIQTAAASNGLTTHQRWEVICRILAEE